MKKETLEYRMMLEKQRAKIPDSKRLTGSTTDKYPITLDDGRTTIFIADKNRESEIRERYELRQSNRIIFSSGKPKV